MSPKAIEKQLVGSHLDGPNIHDAAQEASKLALELSEIAVALSDDVAEGRASELDLNSIDALRADFGDGVQILRDALAAYRDR